MAKTTLFDHQICSVFGTKSIRALYVLLSIRAIMTSVPLMWQQRRRLDPSVVVDLAFAMSFLAGSLPATLITGMVGVINDDSSAQSFFPLALVLFGCAVLNDRFCKYSPATLSSVYFFFVFIAGIVVGSSMSVFSFGGPVVIGLLFRQLHPFTVLLCCVVVHVTRLCGMQFFRGGEDLEELDRCSLSSTCVVAGRCPLCARWFSLPCRCVSSRRRSCRHSNFNSWGFKRPGCGVLARCLEAMSRRSFRASHWKSFRPRG